METLQWHYVEALVTSTHNLLRAESGKDSIKLCKPQFNYGREGFESSKLHGRVSIMRFIVHGQNGGGRRRS